MNGLLEAPVADEWLTRAEVAAALRVSERTVDRWANAGRLARHHLGGSPRLVRFRAAEVRLLARIEDEQAGETA